MKKTTTLALGSVTALAASTHSDAAIVYFDVNPDQTISDGGGSSVVSFGSINLGTGTYTLNGTSGTYMQFETGEGTWVLASNIESAGLNDGDWRQSYKLTYGATISAAALDDWGAAPTAAGYPSWYPSGNGYIGLRINNGGGNYNYGWAHLNFVFNGSFGTLTISGFAFEDQINTAILAGAQGSPSAVPEPGQVASSILLLAGIAGYFAYRRRVGAASEPDALHKLALGARGIADFRADKAA